MFYADSRKRKITFDVATTLLESDRPSVDSSNTSTQETSDESSCEEKFSTKMMSLPEETYQKEIDILQKLFPQKEKVAKLVQLSCSYNDWDTRKCINIIFTLAGYLISKLKR